MSHSGAVTSFPTKAAASTLLGGTCHGTRTVRITCNGQERQREGMVAVYLPDTDNCQWPRDSGGGSDSGTHAESSSTSVSKNDGKNQGSREGAEAGTASAARHDHLSLLLTDGRETYVARINASDVRGGGGGGGGGATSSKLGSKQNQIARVKGYLLDDDDDDRNSRGDVSYELRKGDKGAATTTFHPPEGSDGCCHVKVSIRERIVRSDGSSMVKIIWTGKLLPDTSSSSGQTPSSALPFVVSVGRSVNVLLEEVSSLRRDNQSLEQSVVEWKQTAQALDGEMKRRQNELLENFLVLLNRTKADLRKARRDLEEEKKKKRVVVVQQQNALVRAGEGRRDQVVDHEDEHDFEEFDSDMVQRLAAGASSAKSRGSRRNLDGSSKEKRKNGDAGQPKAGTPKKDAAPLTESPRNTTPKKNPHTGAIEMWDAKAIFREDEEEVHKSAEVEGEGRKRLAGESQGPGVSETNEAPLNGKRRRVEACRSTENSEGKDKSVGRGKRRGVMETERPAGKESYPTDTHRKPQGQQHRQTSSDEDDDDDGQDGSEPLL